MPDKAEVPKLSAAGEKAFEEFRALEFVGSCHFDAHKATLALCAMYNLEFSQAEHLIPNRSMPELANTQAQVKTFMHAMAELEQSIKAKHAPFDIRHMNVLNQAEAKDKATKLIQTLTTEVQQSFPAEYAEAIAAMGDNRRTMYR
jgi:hypothetical protein